jgi:hypothetical protein
MIKPVYLQKNVSEKIIKYRFNYEKKVESMKPNMVCQEKSTELKESKNIVCSATRSNFGHNQHCKKASCVRQKEVFHMNVDI